MAGKTRSSPALGETFPTQFRGSVQLLPSAPSQVLVAGVIRISSVSSPGVCPRRRVAARPPGRRRRRSGLPLVSRAVEARVRMLSTVESLSLKARPQGRGRGRASLRVEPRCNSTLFTSICNQIHLKVLGARSAPGSWGTVRREQWCHGGSRRGDFRARAHGGLAPPARGDPPELP
jgi:hypothetical protein